MGGTAGLAAGIHHHIDLIVESLAAGGRAGRPFCTVDTVTFYKGETVAGAGCGPVEQGKAFLCIGSCQRNDYRLSRGAELYFGFDGPDLAFFTRRKGHIQGQVVVQSHGQSGKEEQENQQIE